MRPTFFVSALASAFDADADEVGGLVLAQGPGLDLGAVDGARVYVAAAQQKWRATFGSKVGTRRFENPHQAFVTANLGAVAVGRVELPSARLAPGIAGAERATSAPSWQLDVSTPPPDRRRVPRLRGRSRRGGPVRW